MTDKEKIKEEIERLKTQNETYLDKEYAESTKWYKIGAYDACNAILSFINSIPEESVSKDLESQYKSNMRYQHTYTQDDLMKTKNEDLEEEIDRYLDLADLKTECIGITSSQDYFDDITKTAYHFAEWQKQKSMQDFLEYLKYCSTFTDTNGITRIDNDLLSAFIEDFKNYMKNE